MTELLGTGRQTSITDAARGTVLTSAIFMISNSAGQASFSELAGISSEVEQTEYMQAGAKGPEFGRFVGKTKPPSITLKRAMGAGGDTTWIWAWHSAARAGLPGAYRETTFKLYGTGEDPTGAGSLSYTLVNAFPSKVEIGGMKAGATEIVIQTVTLQCDEIIESPK